MFVPPPAFLREANPLANCNGSGLPKVSPFAIPREAGFVAVADFAHRGAETAERERKKMRRGKLSGSVL